MGSSSKTTTQKTDGGSESTSTTTPFQQPFYAQMLGQAQNLYESGLPNYYGGPTVAGYTPAQMESMNLTSNYITDPAQQRMYDTGQQFDSMLSGQVISRVGVHVETYLTKGLWKKRSNRSAIILQGCTATLMVKHSRIN